MLYYFQKQAMNQIMRMHQILLLLLLLLYHFERMFQKSVYNKYHQLMNSILQIFVIYQNLSNFLNLNQHKMNHYFIFEGTKVGVAAEPEANVDAISPISAVSFLVLTSTE